MTLFARWLRASLGALAGSFFCAVSTVHAQVVHATQVVAADTRGNLGGGIFQPANALGAPQGGGLAQGSTQVHSLGHGGSLVLRLPVALRDGPGADFLVAENPFVASAGFGAVFGEAVFVEVSSNGSDFARFSARYHGPDIEPGPFGVVDLAHYEQMAGLVPVLAGSAAFPNADPRDVVEAGGDAFDLADLQDHPLVVAGTVDLAAVTFVRLVDVRSGIDRDQAGRLIRDTGAGGSADIDAITAIHHQQDPPGRGPVVQLAIAADGRFTLDIDDPDGWQDLAPGSLRASVQGLPFDAASVLAGCQVLRADATGFTLVHPVPLPTALRYRLAVSVRDRAGHRSGVARIRP